MALPLTKENFFWHKLHSLTGVIPIGFYMVQHLSLNSFSIGGPESFNGVINFFESIPKHVLLVLEIVAIWIPLLFHAVYGVFIASRGEGNYFTSKYGWSQNRMYSYQRYSGIFLLAFLIYHIATTTILKYLTHNPEVIKFAAWATKLHNPLVLAFYMIGILAASYHLAYGIWNFCIRWGITISQKAQEGVQKFSLVAFIALTALGWGALAGFLIPHEPESAPSIAPQADGRISM